MFCCLLAIGGLGWSTSKDAYLAVGLLFVVSTLCNMITIGPVCYPIVAETPSGRLRYKTIVIGRFVYNLTAIFNNAVTPRMISASGQSIRTGIKYLTDRRQDGAGAQRPVSSMLVLIYSASFGAGSAFQRLKTVLLEKLISYSRTRFPRGSLSILKSIVSSPIASLIEYC